MSSDVFWRKEPLSQKEDLLLEALRTAHEHSTFRDNPSSLAVVQSFYGSGDYCKAIAGALMTMGGLHAPIEETIRFLKTPEDQIAELTMQYLTLGRRVPGWGNGFVKGKPDSIWSGFELRLGQDFPDMAKKLVMTTNVIQATGKKVYPNPSAYTSAAAIIIGLPDWAGPYLLIYSRLGPWTQLMYRSCHGT